MDDSILNIIIIIIIIFFFIIEHLTFADCQNIPGERYTLWRNLDGYRLHGWFSVFHLWQGMSSFSVFCMTIP